MARVGPAKPKTKKKEAKKEGASEGKSSSGDTLEAKVEKTPTPKNTGKDKSDTEVHPRSDKNYKEKKPYDGRVYSDGPVEPAKKDPYYSGYQSEDDGHEKAA